MVHAEVLLMGAFDVMDSYAVLRWRRDVACLCYVLQCGYSVCLFCVPVALYSAAGCGSAVAASLSLPQPSSTELRVHQPSSWNGYR